MKNYLKYLRKNPAKLFLISFIVGIAIATNVFANTSEFNIWLSICTGIFSTLITCLILLQVWGEYKEIEGFWPTIKAYFKWK